MLVRLSHRKVGSFLPSSSSSPLLRPSHYRCNNDNTASFSILTNVHTTVSSHADFLACNTGQSLRFLGKSNIPHIKLEPRPTLPYSHRFHDAEAIFHAVIVNVFKVAPACYFAECSEVCFGIECESRECCAF